MRFSKQAVLDNFDELWSLIPQDRIKQMVRLKIQQAPDVGYNIPVQFVDMVPGPVQGATEAPQDALSFAQIAAMYGKSAMTPRCHKDKLKPCGTRRTGDRGPSTKIFTLASVKKLAQDLGWEEIVPEPTLITSDIELLAQKSFAQTKLL